MFPLNKRIDATSTLPSHKPTGKTPPAVPPGFRLWLRAGSEPGATAGQGATPTRTQEVHAPTPWLSRRATRVKPQRPADGPDGRATHPPPAATCAATRRAEGAEPASLEKRAAEDGEQARAAWAHARGSLQGALLSSASLGPLAGFRLNEDDGGPTTRAMCSAVNRTTQGSFSFSFI